MFNLRNLQNVSILGGKSEGDRADHTTGIDDGYNKAVDIENNYLPGQNIVAGGCSLNYRYPEKCLKTLEPIISMSMAT